MICCMEQKNCKYSELKYISLLYIHLYFGLLCTFFTTYLFKYVLRSLFNLLLFGHFHTVFLLIFFACPPLPRADSYMELLLMCIFTRL